MKRKVKKMGLKIEKKYAVIVEWTELHRAYKEKYNDYLDIEDIYWDVCNDCYKEFDIAETIYECEANDTTNSACYRVAQILLNVGCMKDDYILIHVDW